MSAGRLRARWAALTGTGGAASVALALLVLGCVFVSVAGPRESLGFRSRALQSSLAATTPLVRSVLVTTSYTDFTVPFQGPITAGTLAEARGQLRANLARTGLPLAPAAADWSTMTTAYDIAGGAARSAFDGPDPPELAVSYSDALSRHARLIAGSFPGAGAGRRLPIAVTASTARRFGLHVGSRLTMDEARLTVAGIVRPVHPGAAFWTANQNAAMPAPPVTRGPAYWTGTVFMGAAEVGAMQSYFKLFDGQLEWDFPLALGGVNADQAVTLHNELNRASLRAGGLRLADSTVNVDVGSALGDRLLGFITADAALADLLSLLYVSLAVLGVIVVLLGARMLAEHRRPDFGLMRARGASRPQLALLALAGGAAAAVPAALAGTALAVAATPGYAEPLAWWLAAATVAFALAGPPVIALGWADADQAAGARTLDLQPGVTAGARRWVAEGSIVLLAAGGLVELHQQGLPRGGGINFYISAAPVLVAVPAALLVIRLSPLALRGLLRIAAGRPGVTAFVGFARAARTSLAATLPAFALVLALTVVAFGFMVRTAVVRGQVGASWRAAGADAVISLANVPGSITAAQQRAIAAVPGASRTAAVAVTAGTRESGAPVTAVLVSPASYAAMVAGTPYPRVPAALLAEPAGGAGTGAPVPALASPAAAAQLRPGTAVLSTEAGTLRVRVAGLLSGTPAVPGGGSFIVVPAWATSHLAAQAPPTELLITGPRLNDRALAAAVARIIPDATITFRSSVLAGLSGAALPHGAYVAFAEGSGAAAGFCVLVLLLSLVLAARSRAQTLARLSTMGLGTGQGRLLVIVEALPPVLAAAAAGAACALALVPLLGPVLDLSVFTGSGAAVPVRADLAALAIPAAGLIILGAVTLSVQAIAASRRGAAGALRISG
jgi:putative ABC transport system permease protein